MLSRTQARRVADTPNLFVTPLLSRRAAAKAASAGRLTSPATRGGTLTWTTPKAKVSKLVPSRSTFLSGVAPVLPPDDRSLTRVEVRAKAKLARAATYGTRRTVLDKELTFLEQEAVSPAARRDYLERYQKFMAWVSGLGLTIATVDDLDLAVTWYMNEEFFEGAPGTDASKLLAAMGHWVVQLSRGAPQLTRGHLAARGWRRLSPATTRLPLPWLCVLLIVEQLMLAQAVDMAVATVLTFALYLRPSELLRIRRRHVVPPGRKRTRGGSSAGHWSVVLHPSEMQIPSKTGVYDETLVLDNPEFSVLDAWLARLVSGNLDAPLISFSYRDWATHFQAACELADLGLTFKAVLYQLRHGGASHEAFTRFRDVTGIQGRGRWASMSGPRRYSKPGRINQMLGSMDPTRLAHARQLNKSLGRLLQLP